MAERRIEILVDTNATAEKLISFLTSPAVTEMLTNAGGKIEGIANLNADSLGGFDQESNMVETVVKILGAASEENSNG